MKNNKFSRRSAAKIAIITGFAVGFAAFSLTGSRQEALASAYGPAASHTGAVNEANCTACHADFAVNSGEGSVEITGIPSSYTPGQQFNVTVTARQADAVIYGFQLTAINGAGQKVGTFEIPAASENRAQVVPGALMVGQDLFLRDYVEHTSGGLSNGQFGFNSWTFKWTAPSQSAGRIDFYAAANCANSDGGLGGDYIYTTATSTSAASSSTNIAISGRVFTPSGQALRSARVVLTAPNGTQQVSVTSSFGNYSFSNLPNGAQYTIGVQSKRYRFAPRVITPTDNVANADFTGLE